MAKKRVQPSVININKPIDVEAFTLSTPVTKMKQEPIISKPPRMEMSMPIELGNTQNQTIEQKRLIAEQKSNRLKQSEINLQEEALRNNAKAQLALAGAQFAIDVFNAQNQYQQTTGVAQFNIMQARNQAADAIFRGREAGFQRQLEGVKAGESALLAMAAQGQSVTGAGVQRIQGSLEAIGIENSMREEINAIREALGFELEEVKYGYEMDMAKINRDMSMISSGLEFGAGAYGSGALSKRGY